ncbi:PilZ domain-containing protein [bacterium]|nr:PilZ domain-containing protein [bacterium]
MDTELFSVHNRRVRQRCNHQVKVQGENLQGLTLNLSLRGARIVSRSPLRRRFLLRLELDRPLIVDAEKVWEAPLGGGNRVFGVRFMPAPEQQALLAAWLQTQATGLRPIA